MNPNDFTGAFRASTGLHADDFVLRRRVERALALLKQPDVELANIASEVGFSTQVQLVVAFGKVLGIHPAYYRAQLLDFQRGVSPATPP